VAAPTQQAERQIVWPEEIPAGVSRPLRILLQKPGSRVYLARQNGVPRDVVVKLIYLGEPALEDSFQQEIAALSVLRHPNNVRLLDAGRLLHNREPFGFLILEHIQGTDLRGLLRADGALGLTRTLWIIRQILYGLAEAHQQGVLHRDLKPSNLMISHYVHRRDHVTIIDYGLARVRLPSFNALGLQERNAIVGTLNYIPPEVLLGRSYSMASDLYNVGLILYECLTGQHPFAESDFRTVAHHHLYTRPVSIQDFADFPDELARAVSQALSKDPGDRFQTADELLDALAPLDQHEPLSRARPLNLRARDLSSHSIKRAEPRRVDSDVHAEIWVLDDAFSTHPQTVDQLLRVPGFRGRVISMEDYDALLQRLQSGTQPPPAVMAFGVLSTFVEDQLLTWVSDNHACARLLVADKIEVNLLTEIVNRYGVEYLLQPPITSQALHDIIDRLTANRQPPLLQLNTPGKKTYVQTWT
jgi:serine/threonine protein kinase